LRKVIIATGSEGIGTRSGNIFNLTVAALIGALNRSNSTSGENAQFCVRHHIAHDSGSVRS
jgi:hypothetical protein